MSDPHQELAKFDQAVAEHEARQLADEIGYTFGVLTDGTIVLEPPRDPEHQARFARSIDELFPENPSAYTLSAAPPTTHRRPGHRL